GPLAIEIHPERAHRPSATARLLGLEPAEEEPAPGCCLGDRERARCAELVIEGLRDFVAVIRGFGGARDPTAHFSLVLRGEASSVVTEILRDGRDLGQLDAVIEPFPARIAVEMLGLYGRLRFVGAADLAANRDREHQRHCNGWYRRAHGSGPAKSHGISIVHETANERASSGREFSRCGEESP